MSWGIMQPIYENWVRQKLGVYHRNGELNVESYDKPVDKSWYFNRCPIFNPSRDITIEFT